MALLQKTLLFIAVWNRVDALEAADYTFGRFCKRPPNFGTGQLIEDDTCKVTYNVELDTDVAAANFCDQQHPYSLKSFERDKRRAQTICTIGSYFKCGDSEVLIDKTCYILKEDKDVDILDAFRSGCGSKHAVHKFKSQFEQKWVATFFTKHPMLWIANKPNDSITKHLRFALREEVLVSKNGRMKVGKSRVMVIVTSARTHTKIPRGSIVRASEDLSLPVLCSRPAEELPSYVPALMEKFSELGLTSYIKKDGHDKDRPFFVLREYSSFDMSEDDAKDKFMIGTKRLHKGCSAFLNGYAASPRDFKYVNDFKDILKKESVNIVSVPGRRKPEPKLKNEETCKRTLKKGERHLFEFILQNGASQSAAEDSAWAENNPDRTCADTPRIALGFSQKGLVDIPATARHFTVCTYGEAPPKPDEKCHFTATFDEKTEKCTCKPGTDINYISKKRFKLTESEKSLTNDGKLCLDCEVEAYHSLVILLDFAKDDSKADTFFEIATQMLLPFFATESYITLMAWGPNYDFQNRGRYGVAHDGNNYDYWRDHLKTIKSGSRIWQPRSKTFEAIKDRFDDAPKHRRVLIIVTSGEGEEKDLEIKSKLMEVKNTKNPKVFLFVVDKEGFKPEWPIEERYDVSSSGYLERQLGKAATDIGQQVGRNVCLRY